MATSTQKSSDNLYQMSNDFAKEIIKKIKEYNLTFSKYCALINVNKYYLRKVMDRKIQMACHLSFLEKIAERTNISGIKLFK